MTTRIGTGGLPPVPAYGPPQRRRTPLDAEIGRRAGEAVDALTRKPWSLGEAARRAVVNLGEAEIEAIHGEVTRLMGFVYMSRDTLRAVLSKLERGGEIRRIRYGVYGPPVKGED